MTKSYALDGAACGADDDFDAPAASVLNPRVDMERIRRAVPRDSGSRR